MRKNKQSTEVTLPEGKRALAEHEMFEKKLKEQDLAVQNQIALMDPKEQAAVRSMQFEVQSEIDKLNDDLFSEEVFDASSRNAEASRTGNSQPVGKIFKYDVVKKIGTQLGKNDYILIRTPFSTTIPAQSYIDTLQDRIIGVTAELELLKRQNDDLYNKLAGYGDVFATGNLTFFSLIKLAFSRLFRRT